MKINELDKKELIKLNKWNKLTMSLLEKDYPVHNWICRLLWIKNKC